MTSRRRAFSPDELNVRERVTNREEQPVGVERLLQEIERATLCGLDGRGDGSVTGDHDDLRRPVEIVEARERFEAVEPGHLHVEEDQMGMELRVERDGLAAGRRDPDLEILVLEDLFERLPDAGFVVDDEDAMTHDPPSSRVS